MKDRKEILLRAAYELLSTQKYSPFVVDVLGETAFYDGADCDGYCLLEDIADEIGIEEA